MLRYNFYFVLHIPPYFKEGAIFNQRWGKYDIDCTRGLATTGVCTFGSTEPTHQYYWGKVNKVFSNDDDIDVTQIKKHVLQKTGLRNLLSWNWGEKIKDVTVISTKWILFGLIEHEIRQNLHHFPDGEATAILRRLKEEVSCQSTLTTGWRSHSHQQKQERFTTNETMTGDWHTPS